MKKSFHSNMSHLKAIKPSFLHHPEYRQTERLRILDNSENFKAEQACLLKYFPKHYRRLRTDISMKDWPLISRLRQIKTIDYFTSFRVSNLPKTRVSKGLFRIEQKILRNKRKSVKSLPLLATQTRSMSFKQRHLHINPFFPMITNLNLTAIRDLNFDPNEVMVVDRVRARNIRKCHNYFWRGFRKLRCLEFSNTVSHAWFIIKEINSSSVLLARLKILKLSLRLEMDDDSDHILHQLARNGSFLRHLTHLDCEKFEGFQYYDGFLSELLTQCPNLVSLNFPIGRQAHRYSTPDEIYVECESTEALEHVGRMNQLQELSVLVYGIKTFIKHFSPPKSLRKLVLNIFHSFYDPALLDRFNSKFFERWEGLSHLETLKIKMRRTAQSNNILRKFVLPLLQMTPDLKRFRLVLVNSPAFHATICEKLDLSLFNKRVSSTLKQLESFKVLNCTNALSYSPNLITFDPKKSYFLSNLRRVSIQGDLSETFDFKSFLQLFSIENGDPKKSLKMSTLRFNSVEAFSEHLKVANQVISMKNLDMELEIMLKTRDLGETLSFLKVPIVLERGLIIKLNICLIKKIFGPGILTIIEQNSDTLKRIFANLEFRIIESSI